MQKLLIHINFLLAFIVLLCSHSAFGQQSVSTQWPQSRYWTIVDLGLNFSVYWADRNVKEINNNSYVEKCFTWQEAKDWNSSHNYPYWEGYWRTPTKSELEELKNLQHNYSVVSPGIRLESNNGYFIDIPASGFYNSSDIHGGNGRRAYLWSSTPKSSLDSYYLIYSSHTHVNVVYGGLLSWKMPIRPVLDKCKNVKITVIYSDGRPSTTTTSDYPIGTTINITCDACHKYRCVEKKGSTERETNIISNSNVTYEVTFSIKTTDIVATTEDDQKGTVGILEPINN